jgi:hypothetical protein
MRNICAESNNSDENKKEDKATLPKKRAKLRGILRNMPTRIAQLVAAKKERQ